MDNENIILDADDIAYVADMLKAVVWAKNDLGSVSQQSLDCLEQSLKTAEASLRRLAAEMRGSESNFNANEVAKS